MMLLSKEISRILKEKKILFAAWNATNINDNPYQNWYLPLRDTMKEVVMFDTAQNYFRYGKNEMNHKLLTLIAKEKPDYLFTLMIYDELDPLFFQEVKKRSPETLILSLFSDDDWRYEDYSRYYNLFIDYPIINITDMETDKGHKKDGIRHYSLSLGMNCKLFKPLHLKKEYDVSFVGRPNASRVEYIKFLIEKGVDLKVWGDGWENYLQIAKAYQGHASAEDLVRITNESKINLSFTKGGYGKLQMKGRVFEATACKGFTLIERFNLYEKYFKEGKEMIMFDDKEDLLKKITYYLKHEKERQIIAENAYRKTLKNYNKHRELIKYFKKILSVRNDLQDKKLPAVPQIALLSKKDVYSKNLASKITNASYVGFIGGEKHPFQFLIQAYALQKTNKNISCCDAYFSRPGLPRYLLLKSKQASIYLKHDAFQNLIQSQQLLIKKEFFIENISVFKKYFQEGSLPLLTKESIAFVSIPLVTLRSFPALSEKEFEKSIHPKFLDMLYALWYQKRIFFHPYAYALILEAVSNKNIRYVLIKNLKDHKKLKKVKKGL